MINLTPDEQIVLTVRTMEILDGWGLSSQEIKALSSGPIVRVGSLESYAIAIFIINKNKISTIPNFFK